MKEQTAKTSSEYDVEQISVIPGSKARNDTFLHQKKDRGWLNGHGGFATAAGIGLAQLPVVNTFAFIGLTSAIAPFAVGALSGGVYYLYRRRQEEKRQAKDIRKSRYQADLVENTVAAKAGIAGLAVGSGFLMASLGLSTLPFLVGASAIAIGSAALNHVIDLDSNLKNDPGQDHGALYKMGKSALTGLGLSAALLFGMHAAQPTTTMKTVETNATVIQMEAQPTVNSLILSDNNQTVVQFDEGKPAEQPDINKTVAVIGSEIAEINSTIITDKSKDSADKVAPAETQDVTMATFEKFSDEYLGKVAFAIDNDHVENPEILGRFAALQDIAEAHKAGKEINIKRTSMLIKDLGHYLLSDPCNDFEHSYKTLSAHLYALSDDMGNEQGKLGRAYILKMDKSLLDNYHAVAGAAPQDDMKTIAVEAKNIKIAESAECFHNAWDNGNYSMTNAQGGCEDPFNAECREKEIIADGFSAITLTMPMVQTAVDTNSTLPTMVVPTTAPPPPAKPELIGTAHVDAKNVITDYGSWCNPDASKTTERPAHNHCTPMPTAVPHPEDSYPGIKEETHYQSPVTENFTSAVRAKTDYIAVTAQTLNGQECRWKVDNMVKGTPTQLHTLVSGIFSQITMHLTHPTTAEECPSYILGMGVKNAPQYH